MFTAGGFVPRVESGTASRPCGADDRVIWQHAKANGFNLVTQDADFAEMALLYGPPPKVIWLRCGNQPTAVVEKLLRNRAEAIISFEQDNTAACWEIY